MNKDLVFIVSSGRTGTKFLGNVLGKFIDGAFSVHEPDVFFAKKPITNMHKIREFGIYHMIIGRALGVTGIRNLNMKYLHRKFGRESEIIRSIHHHRDRYFSRISEDLVIESNYQWYGLLPLLRRAYPYAKIVAVVRDPRDWVVSQINFGGRYDLRDVAGWLRQQRLTPAGLGDSDLMLKWKYMSQFEKLCWNWNVIYSKIMEFSLSDNQCKLYKYEDLLLNRESDSMVDLIKFIVDFEGRTYNFQFHDDVRQVRMNVSRGRERNWTEWSREQAVQLEKFCGPLMRSYGYGREPEWNAKLSK